MARAYSLDLRERVVAAAREEDLTRAEVAQRFGIGEATLYNWLRRWQDEGSLVPRRHGGGRRPSLDEGGMQQLKMLVEEQNDRTLEEYRALLAEKTGGAMSTSALDRALTQLALPRKKRRFTPPSRSETMSSKRASSCAPTCSRAILASLSL